MSILFLDCSLSGLSGDIMISVLHDLGVPEEKFQDVANAIRSNLEGIEQFSVSFTQVPCGGVQAIYLREELKENKQHRTIETLEKGLNATCHKLKLSHLATQVAKKILSCITNAEKKIHSIPSNTLHLHELAAADTIFDAVGVALGLDYLSLLDPNGRIFVTNIAVGGGIINIAHGPTTVPAPATIEILQQTNLILQGGPINRELLTPTGAAILAGINAIPTKFMPPMKGIKIGRGAGILAKEGISMPVVGYLGNNPLEQKITEEITLLETNIDDVPGEYIGHALENILEAGALDAYISPILMKKSRPANILHVLCKPEDAPKFLEIIQTETGTLGIRVLNHHRICFPREFRIVKIGLQGKEYEVRIKVAGEEKSLGFKPEYEDLVKISREVKIPVSQLAKKVIGEYIKGISEN